MLLKPFMRKGVMPLPVTFISTISRDGVRNIAPWSCVMPVLGPLDLAHHEPFGAMLPDGRDPLADVYNDP